MIPEVVESVEPVAFNLKTIIHGLLQYPKPTSIHLQYPKPTSVNFQNPKPIAFTYQNPKQTSLHLPTSFKHLKEVTKVYGSSNNLLQPQIASPHHTRTQISIPICIIKEVKRLFALGVTLGIGLPSMENHTRKYLISKVSNSGPVLKPIPTLPIKKQIHKDYVVQNFISIENVDIVPVHEERKISLPLLGLEYSFLSLKDASKKTTEEIPPGFEHAAKEFAYDTDSTSLEYPPGYELVAPNLVDDNVSYGNSLAANLSDDTSSNDHLVPVIPRKLSNELRRLGMSIEVISSPTSRTKRGLNSNRRRTVVHKFLQMIRAPIIILQETKMMQCSSWDIKQICGSKNVGWTLQQSVGNSGGMLILWDRDFLEVSDSLVGDYTLSILCKNKNDNFQWVLTNVYGPNHSVERTEFWIELDNVCRYWINIPWCIGGDFNTIVKCGEKKNCKRITRSMRKFNTFIVENDLIDLPLKGARYTWSNGQSNPVMQLAKAIPTSDHIPLLLYISDPSWGPSPFRFDAMWFMENGTPSTVLWLKLKALKEKLKVWNKEVFGHTTTKLNIILSDFQTLDLLGEDNVLTEEERNVHLQNKVEFEKISKMEETKRLQEHIVGFYKTLFTEEEIIRPDLKGIDFDSITATEAIILYSDFSEDEVVRAIRDLGNDKALGPDGFPIIFFQKCWHFIKGYFMATVNKFCTTGNINSKHNSTFITLIPKKDHIETIKDCRPICLLTSVYKIIAKVLSTRLKLVMDKLISPVQCAYIEGRQIIDGTLIANELVDSRLRSGNAGILCKIDLEKAFDRINWNYLESVLIQMGFTSKWRNWLRFCYATSSFSVLINGSSFGCFTSTRGVRQGCPVSPLLFNIAMEGVSRYIDRVANQDLFSVFSVTPTSTIVNHLHYADDTIFFVENNKEQLHNLFSALQCFEYIAGLKVNTTKTRLISVGEVPNLALWAEEFGCAIDCLPFQYLGMPLGAKSSSKRIWDPIIEKFDARLSVWRRISLSKGVCATKEKGGLSVYNLRLMNLSLLAKWCWRFGVEKRKLWYKIIEEKYGSEFSYWNPGNIATTYGTSCWRAIAETANLVSSNSTLYLHSGGWKFDFRRVLSNTEVVEFATLLTIIGDNPPTQDDLKDTRRWKLNHTGVFTVKSLYAKLVAEDGVNHFPYSFISKTAIPPKINILMWCLIHGKLNTIDILQHKAMDLHNSCVLCGIGVESQDHLFLHCKIAYKIWSIILLNTGWSWVLPGSMRILAESWHHNHFSRTGNYIWDLIPAAVVNTIWNERNCRRFEEQYIYKTDDDLVLSVKSSILVWATAT
ncbi:uncharacterized protein LOC113334324, partial [Papaver somniferum]|uniref:uncharacterized protein LOC113334324 n=1 Tax=Papaver somniferum TaxID=3469 RepID=UPI000E6FA191